MLNILDLSGFNLQREFWVAPKSFKYRFLIKSLTSASPSNKHHTSISYCHKYLSVVQICERIQGFFWPDSGSFWLSVWLYIDYARKTYPIDLKFCTQISKIQVRRWEKFVEKYKKLWWCYQLLTTTWLRLSTSEVCFLVGTVGTILSTIQEIQTQITCY